MSRLLRRTALFSALLVGLPPAVRADAKPVPQPRMVIVEPVFDAGEVAPGASVAHDFEIRNEGDATLLVSDVVAGCACTTFTLDKEIAPGATGGVRAVLDTSGMTGPMAKQISIYTNDPQAAKSVLTLRVTVTGHLELRPEGLHLEGVRHDAPAVVGATLWAVDQPDLQVLRVESTDASIKVSFRPAMGSELAADGQGRQWRIEAALDPAAPLGPVAALARIYTNHRTDGPLAFSIWGRQREPLALIPPEAALGDVQPGPDYRRALRLENLSASPVEIVAVTSDIPALSVEVSKLPDGKSFTIALRLDAAMPKGEFAGKLVIQTTSRLMPRLEAPVTGRAQ